MEHVWEENGGTDRDHSSHGMTEYEQRNSGVFPGHHLKLRWHVHGKGLLVPNRRQGKESRETEPVLNLAPFPKNTHNAKIHIMLDQEMSRYL